MKLLVFGYCDSSVREKDWRCRQRGAQVTRARHRRHRQDDLARVPRTRERLPFSRKRLLYYSHRISNPSEYECILV